jgi:hypothetical protein
MMVTSGEESDDEEEEVERDGGGVWRLNDDEARDHGLGFSD